MFVNPCGSWRGRAAFVVAMFVSASASAAAQINLFYDYGNPAGCENLKSGAYDDDSMFSLTREGFSSYVTSCEFLQALRPKNDSYVVTVICGHEGDEALTLEMYRIQKAADGADAYEIYTKDGDLWQWVEPCLGD